MAFRRGPAIIPTLGGGGGARLDLEPQLLFKLRRVDENELIAQAGVGVPLARKGPAAKKVIERGELADIFGVEIAGEVAAKTATRRSASRPAPAKPTAKRKTASASAVPSRAAAATTRKKPTVATKRGRTRKA